MIGGTSGLLPGRPARMAPRRLLLVLLVALVPARASAQWVFIQPFVGISFGGDTNIVDLEDATQLRKVTYGGTVTIVGRGIVGVEGDLSLVPGFFERGDSELVTGSRVITLMGNVVIATPISLTGDSLRPYVSGGLGLMRTRVEDVLDIFSTNRSLVGINVGGGAIGFLTDRVGVRWDLRYFRSVGDLDEEGSPVAFGSARLSFWRANMALVLKY